MTTSGASTQEFRAPAAEVDELERVDLYVEVSGGAASWIGRLTSTDGLVFGDIVLVVHPMMLASVDIDTDRVGAPSVVTVDGETRIAFSFGDDEGIARAPGSVRSTCFTQNIKQCRRVSVVVMVTPIRLFVAELFGGIC